jgi:O-antigen ligase
MILAANSRGGQLALAAAALVSLAFLRGKALKIAVAIATLVVIVATIAVGPKLASHSRPDLVAARPKIWHEALTTIKEHPLFGNGPDQFQRVFTERVAGNRDDLLYLAPNAPNAHNLLLVTWTDWGLATVLGLLGLLGWWITRVRRRLSYWQLLPVGMMTAIIVHGVVDTPVLKNDLAMVFWLTILLAEVVPMARTRRFDFPKRSRR